MRKWKAQRLDKHFRHTPLQYSLEQLEVARKRVYLGKTPLDAREPIPTCVCRKSADHFARGVNVVCATCLESYHNKCIEIAKAAAGRLGDDWTCGFCVNAGNAASNSDNMGQSGSDPGDDDEVEAEQTWTLKKVVRKRKGAPKSLVAQDVTYTRFWSDTPAYYQRKKLRRVTKAHGYGSWDELSAAIKTNSEKNMAKMKRYKAEAVAALKRGGHHVSDTQGAHGLQAVQVTVEVLDQLNDEGLLNVEAMDEDDDK